MDITAKQAELDAVTWYHEFDFGNGLRTRTHCHQLDEHRRVWRLIESQLATVDFRGKSVLDIGAWDGYWSFYAEKRGARAVLASDDLGQNWSHGRGIHLAKELLGSSVEIDQNLSVYDLASRGKKFDVILFMGVYYHLHDPFYALAQIRHCCHPGTTVVIGGPLGLGLGAKGALYNFADHNCEWLPTEGALRQLLKATYFTDPTGAYFDGTAETPPGRLGWRWRVKMCRAALRGAREEMHAHLNSVMPREDASKTAVLICAPYEGEVDLHYYQPPLGLHAYDPRFRDAPARRVA
ncbi:methyltransferase domain-containing protein [Frigoriglobus tundricola]|uniref:tRNA (Mo5U34)-methyltransferase n=1 Tax=Frigoriglobus tundricola TaxID=2774151 RepID=A0A6M5YVA3_9BACT|nr:methyltransferase domain-containing protein [Frigoriglobus tundricola]QJW97420.1 hypothetical protein FTUN_4994 [Frigoriglobus tundricola]